MNVLISPDSFKECLSASAVARAMAQGVKKACPSATVRCLPLADGGDGTAEILTRALGGRMLRARVRGPLGESVTARWGYVERRRLALLEMAEASGLALVSLRRRNPLKTSTYGTGELIRAALDRGGREILLGIGGSATVDAGLGMIQALGARIYVDPRRTKLLKTPASGQDLSRLAGIDLSGVDPRLSRTRLRVASDVTNLLYGPRGAARVYGPQKGATAQQVKLLDKGLRRFARVVNKQFRVDPSRFPGAGAAGGLGAGLRVFLNARLESGLARLARKRKKPVFVLAGSLGPGAEKFLSLGARLLVPVTPPGMSRRKAFDQAPRRIALAAEKIIAQSLE
jgi:glycerate kinase